MEREHPVLKFKNDQYHTRVKTTLITRYYKSTCLKKFTYQTISQRPILLSAAYCILVHTTHNIRIGCTRHAGVEAHYRMTVRVGEFFRVLEKWHINSLIISNSTAYSYDRLFSQLSRTVNKEFTLNFPDHSPNSGPTVVKILYCRFKESVMPEYRLHHYIQCPIRHECSATFVYSSLPC